MWFIRMMIEMPRAILTYRKTYKVAKKIERIRKHSLQAGYQYLLDNFPAATLDEEEYYNTLEEIKGLDDEGQLISFLELGCKLGFVMKREVEEEPDVPNWKRWEDGEE